jgi:redox-sensitive bicupin YhaK (pirin superfamily)
MDILTVMVEGQLNHHDSMGHRSVLNAGEMQRMSAGTGIVHSEINEGERPCRLLQVWIEPDRRGRPPGYAQQAFSLDPGWTLLLDPAGASGALTIHRPVRLWRGRVPAEHALPAPGPPSQLGWIQMITGAVTLRGAAGETLALAQGDGLGFAGSEDGLPIPSLVAGPSGADLLWFALA